MGRALEQELVRRGHRVVGVFTGARPPTPEGLRGVELAFEFTTGKSAPSNVRLCVECGVPVVCGSTGWNEQLEKVRGECVLRGGRFLYSPNFSLGINLLLRALGMLGTVFSSAGEKVLATVVEKHHVHKKDKPSGTAIALARALNESGIGRGWHLVEAEGHWTAEGSVPIAAVREGEVVGYHAVELRTELERIVLTHEALSREVFARGAVLAGEWLVGQPPGAYLFEDFLNWLTIRGR